MTVIISDRQSRQFRADVDFVSCLPILGRKMANSCAVFILLFLALLLHTHPFVIYKLPAYQAALRAYMWMENTNIEVDTMTKRRNTVKEGYILYGSSYFPWGFPGGG